MMTELELAAAHEAGHATAAGMRGGALALGSWARHDGTGYTTHRSAPFDHPFIAYAGPWAEARAQWGGDTIDGEDDDGMTFGDYLFGCFLIQPDDRAVAFPPAEYEPPPLPPGVTLTPVEDVWSMELERAWPAIQAKARELAAEAAVTS